MLSRLIQSIFFLCICTTIQAMNKSQKDIVHAKLYEKYEITETPQNYRPVIQPLPNLKLTRSKIRANHIKDLHDMNQHQQALESYKKTENHMPEDLSILKPETQKAYRSIQKFYRSSKNIIKKNSRIDALTGDKNTQTAITEKYINKLNHITDAPECIEKIKFHAYGLFNFTIILSDNNVPCALTNFHRDQLIKIRNTTNPTAAYLVQSTLCLQAINEHQRNTRYDMLSNMAPEHPETELICQFLINYGNDALSPQDVAKKFIENINNCSNDTKQIIQVISNCTNAALSPQDVTTKLIQTVKSQKNCTDMLSAIAKNPLISHVIQKLNHAILENKDKQLISDMHYILAELHYNNEDYVQANAHYKQNTVAFLKEKKAQCKAFKACITVTHSFGKQEINYLSALVNAIEKSPLISEAIQKLSNVTLDNKDPLTPNLHHTLAELHYKNEDYIQAHGFYKKNTATFLKDKKTQRNAFNACVTASQSFDKQDINYLSSLVGNIYNQLKTMDTNNPELSYKVGLLIYALVNNNPGMGISEKTDMLHDALHHLECTQKGVETCIELHTILSTIYAQKNDPISALKHTTAALQLHHSNTQEYALAAILTRAKENNFDFYKQHIQSLQYIIEFIKTGNADIKKNYNLPSEFISSDLWKQLLPYCQQAYAKNKSANNDILYAMALSLVENNNYDTACTYIDALSQPLSHVAQLLKARIYLATEKTMSDEELEATFKAFVHNKKASATDQETVISLLTQSDPPEKLLAQPKHHDLAIKLITKLSDKYTSHAAILLAFNITKHLQIINSPNTEQWQKKLKACDQFYANIAAPSEYNGYTNLAVGLLLINTAITRTYTQIISYFMTALQSKELLPESAQSAQKAIATLYNSWALAITDNPNTQFVLFNKALEYNNNSTIRFNNAIAIFEHSEDQDLINKALQLLKENSTEDCPQKTFSQLALAQAYCNYSTDPAHILVLKKLIPLDINKAIGYLQDHNNQPMLLVPLINILRGKSIWIPKQLAEQYTNLEQALHYLNVLIDTDKDNIDHISLRIELHVALQQTDAAIADIDRMLTAQNISNTRGITKEKLLFNKLELLLQKTPDEALYDQIIECFKQLKTYDERDIIRFNTFPLIQKRTEYLVENNIMADNAIEWCCLAANSYAAANNTTELSKEPTQQEKDLAHYLLSAAKKGNLDAQLIILPYLNAIGHIAENNLTESLRYSYQALCNPNNAQKKANVILLIQLLQNYIVKNGVILAYYILCDYYKNYPEEIKKTMLLFNQAKEHEYPDDDAADLIETISISCKEMLFKHAKCYAEILKSEKNLALKTKKSLQKKSQPTLIDVIATFTLGTMYTYLNTSELLTAAVFYFNLIKNDLCKTFKCPHYERPITMLLGDAYYKLALIKETSGIINYEHLHTSAQIGHRSALHKMAEIYIDQHKSGKQDIPVKTSDFMPLLAKDLNFPPSRKLFKKCADIATSKEEDDKSDDKPVLVSFKANSENLTEFLKANATYITKDQVKKNVNNSVIPEWTPLSDARKTIVKDINDKDVPPNVFKAFVTHNQGDTVTALKDMQFAAYTQKIPSAYMLLAWNYLLGKHVEQNYATAEEHLRNAFVHGLIEKQFCSDNFLYTVYSCMSQLISSSIVQSSVKKRILQIIRNTLTDHGVNMTAFYTVVKESTDIDLLSIPEWSTISDLYTEIQEKTDIDLALIPDKPLNKKVPNLTAIVKDYNNTECPTEIVDAMIEFETGNKAAALKVVRRAATTKKIPSAYMLLACNYLQGDGVKQNYALSQEHLQNALKYGLVGNQLCSANFFGTVCTYISDIILKGHLPSVKQHLLRIITQALTDHNTDTNTFYILVKESTKLDVFRYIEKEALSPFIKNHNYEETSSMFLNGLQAYQHKDRKKAFDYMYKAAIEEHHPTACLYASYHYHKGDVVDKSNKKSNVLLLEALADGLIAGKFYSFQFFIELATYIDSVLFNKNDNTAYSLQIIKSALTVQGIDPTHFCTMYKEYTNLDLASVPEWVGTDTNITHTNAPVEPQLSIIDLKKRLIKDHTNSNLSEDFKKALAATIQKDTIKSTIFIDLAAKNNDPCADITIATNYLLGKEGKNKSLALAACHLKQALKNGLIEKQFYNSLFVNKLCQFIQNVVSISFTSESEIKLKKHLFLEIKKQLRQENINVTDFCNIVANEVNTLLHTCPEWIDAENAAQFTQEEFASSINESLNEFKKEMVKSKNDLIKDPNYEEDSVFFTATQALAKGTPDGIKRGIELIKEAAEKKHHPQACLMLSSTYLRGGNTLKKNLPLSEKQLKNALEYGISQKQFCNNPFLLAFCSYIFVILTDHPKNIKQKLLPIIKNSLEVKNVDLKLFEAAFEKEHAINLSTVPEWSGPDTNTTNTNAPVQPQLSITDLQKKMVKDHTNSNLSDDFKKALTATIQKNIVESTRLLSLAANDQDPCACMTITFNYFTGEGMKKSLYLSGACLKEALKYGLVEQQFCNNFFLKKLCSYIKTIMSAKYAPDDIIFKKRFLHRIKKNLIAHNIDLTDFCHIVLNDTQIDLLTCPEWIESEKNYKLTFEQQGALATDALIVDDNVKQVIMNHLQSLKPKKEIQNKNKLTQGSKYQNSLAFAAVQDAALKGDIKKCMALAKTVAEVEHHPRAYILLAFEHLRGTFLNKDIDTSKKYLINALLYGLIEQQFCDDEFLEDLCDYINFIVKSKYSKNNKQTLLSTIKKALEEKSTELKTFNDMLKKQHKIDLSKVAEWES